MTVGKDWYTKEEYAHCMSRINRLEWKLRHAKTMPPWWANPRHWAEGVAVTCVAAFVLSVTAVVIKWAWAY